MKILKNVMIAVLAFYSLTAFSQEKQEIKKPSEGKSLIYFIRPTAVAFAIDFKVFHKDKFLGAISSNRYMTYECEPGEQLFWAASENRDYVIANLEPNKTYVILVAPQMGAFVAGVNLIPCDPNDRTHKKAFYKAIHKSKEIIYDANVSAKGNQSESVKTGLEKFEKLKESNSDKIAKLNPNMNFLNADKPE